EQHDSEQGPKMAGRKRELAAPRREGGMHDGSYAAEGRIDHAEPLPGDRSTKDRSRRARASIFLLQRKDRARGEKLVPSRRTKARGTKPPAAHSRDPNQIALASVLLTLAR